MGIAYATVEQVSRSLEVLNTSYNAPMILAKLESSSRSIDHQMHRRFYPELRTFKRDWPNYRDGYAWQIDVGDNEIISMSSAVAGGVTIPTASIFLRRGDDRQEPPYTYIEVDLASGYMWAAGPTFQQSLVITALCGYNDTSTTLATGTLAAAIASTTATSITISPANAQVMPGIGSLILCDTERMVVAARSMSTTSQTISADVAATQATRTITSTGAANLAVGETILIDSERMLIDDIVGNNIIVRRAWDGTVLAAHTNGTTIYAPRTYVVKRGQLGSTAATHLISANVYTHEYPALINELCIAETVVALTQNAGAYARTIGSGNTVREATGQGLVDVRAMAFAAYGRKNRQAAI